MVVVVKKGSSLYGRVDRYSGLYGLTHNRSRSLNLW